MNTPNTICCYCIHDTYVKSFEVFLTLIFMSTFMDVHVHAIQARGLLLSQCLLYLPWGALLRYGIFCLVPVTVEFFLVLPLLIIGK